MLYFTKTVLAAKQIFSSAGENEPEHTSWTGEQTQLLVRKPKIRQLVFSSAIQ